MSLPTDPSGEQGLLSPVYAGSIAESLTGDDAVVQAMLRSEAALLGALVTCGIAPAECAAGAELLNAVEVDTRALSLAAVAGGNPVIPLVGLLRSAVPETVAPWVHHGATSQDILDTALMLVAADACLRAEADLTRLAEFLAELSDRTRAVPVVARTLTQQALPTTLGMRAAGWLAGVHDAVRALRRCTTLPGLLPASLGGPVGTASAYGVQGPAVLDAYAEGVGLASPVSSWHVRRTPVVELCTALTLTGAACAKIAADLLVMGQTEVGEAREGSGGASSSMAHKSNPVGSVLVTAAARQIPALVAVVAASAFPEQERPAGAWHAEWASLRQALRLAGGAAERSAGYLPDVVWDADAMARNVEGLRAALDEDDAWVGSHVQHNGVWVDRVLAQHKEVFA
jgi:3-carboxy-cis,cis-muconate cycloisomerase